MQMSADHFEETVYSDLWHAGNVLPAMKHAAEELRCLGVSGAEGAGRSLRQAARSANEVLRAGDQTSQQISKLHADAMRVGIAFQYHHHCSPAHIYFQNRQDISWALQLMIQRPLK